MIPRYSRPEMVAIWSPETKFRIWFEIEAYACEALAQLGVIPKEAAKTIWEKGSVAKFDVARIDEIEAVTKHDVIAFLTHLAEFIGPDSRFVHQGMTSSDVLDTTLNVQLVRAADLLLADMDRVLEALKKRAFEHKDTVRIGRSHAAKGHQNNRREAKDRPRPPPQCRYDRFRRHRRDSPRPNFKALQNNDSASWPPPSKCRAKTTDRKSVV